MSVISTFFLVLDYNIFLLQRRPKAKNKNNNPHRLKKGYNRRFIWFHQINYLNQNFAKNKRIIYKIFYFC